MSRSYKYALVQFAANRLRDERLNLALIIFRDSELDVRIPKSLEKIKAISAAVDVGVVRASVEQLSEVYSYICASGRVEPEDGVKELALLSALELSPLGEFFASSSHQYEVCARRLLATLVDPEPAPSPPLRPRSSKLLSDVRSAFKAERILALKGESLENHRILTNYKIAEGLPADFLLKNGSMHVVQTVDASSISAPKRTIQSIAMSALVFESAKMSFGERNTNSNLIYRASSEFEFLISPALDAAEHQGARLINWESRDDRVKFIVNISSLAEPISTVVPNKFAVNASVQPKLKLN